MSREVKEYFQNVSSRWDTLRKGFYGNEVRETIMKSAQITSTDIVLDVGAGTGFLTEEAAKIAKRVIALDLSEAMTNKAIPKVAGQNVEFKIGDAENIPLESASVNVVMGNMVLHHCPRPTVAIAEMARVLTARGRLVLSDLTEHNYESFRKEHADLWLGFPISKVQQIFELAGLQHVNVETLGSCCTSSTRENAEIKIPMFLAKGIKM